MNSDRDVRERERAVAEEAHRQHRLLGPQLPERRTPRSRAHRRRARRRSRATTQPTALPRTRPHTIPKRPALASTSPGRSSLRDRPAALVEPRTARAGASTSPIGTFSQKIQCQEMPDTTAPPTSGPNATARPLIPPQSAEREAAALLRHAGREDRERERHARSRHRVPAPRVRCRASSIEVDERSRRRGEREDAEPDREHQPSPEAVAEGGAGQQQHGEGERVGVDRPLELRERRVQVLPDHRAAPW